MTAERMTDEDLEKRFRYAEVVSGGAHVLRGEMTRARHVEQEQAEKIRTLEDMLRLASDKMAEQVRQERHGLAFDVLREKDERGMRSLLEQVRDANAPKD